MALQPSTHAPAHPRVHASSAHAAHGAHGASHAAGKGKPSLSADDPAEGGGFAAQLLKAQPAAARDARPVEAPKPRTEAKKPSGDHASREDGESGDGQDEDAKTADAKAPPAIDPNALMPWAQQVAPPTTSLADKTAPVAGDGAGDPLGALRKAAGKGNGKEALIASLGAGKEGAKAARAADPLAGAGVALGAPSRGEITAALAKAEDAVKAATDARDSLAALLPQADPVTVQAGAVGASPSAVQDANQGPNQAAPTPPAHAALPMPPQSPTFAPALGHQLDLWMKNGVQHAEVQLSPQDLGPIRVRIEMDGAQTRVHMMADVASTRDALQQAMPQLSDQLGLAGISLAGGSVSDQPSFQQSQAQAQANADGSFGGGGRASGATRGAGDVSGDPGIASAARQQVQRRGLLDLYA